MSPRTASQIARLSGLAVREARQVGSQHGYQHFMITLAGGRRAFAKVIAGEVSPDSAAAFAAEANGLRWLGEPGAVPVPEVLAAERAVLVISMITPGQATPEAAFRFGAELAQLHAAGADSFGAPWQGFIASLPLDNTQQPPWAGTQHPPWAGTQQPPWAGTQHPPWAGTQQPPWAGTQQSQWPDWYASRRLLPYLRLATDSGALGRQDGQLVEAVMDRIGSLAGPAEPPSRIHGDCWAGNVLWSGGGGWLIDPAAHGGHRETDLAMLALFGAPHLDRIMAGYNDTVPLAAGWRSRVPLHQLHPLLVHACLFGASYRDAVHSAARAALTS